MSPNAECQERDDGDLDGPLSREDLPGLFRSHADALNRVVDSFAEEIETDGEPTARRLNSVRTELVELEAAIEDFGAGLCNDAEPWEHLDDYSPWRQ